MFWFRCRELERAIAGHGALLPNTVMRHWMLADMNLTPPTRLPAADRVDYANTIRSAGNPVGFRPDIGSLPEFILEARSGGGVFRHRPWGMSNRGRFSGRVRRK